MNLCPSGNIGRVARAIVSGVCAAIVGAGAARARDASFQFDNRTLTVKTDRYELTWCDGSMVRLVSLLPQRREISVTAGKMAVTDLPNGLGSFHGLPPGKVAQNFVVFGHHLKKGKAQFPAQHPPCAASVVTCRKMPNGARLTYKGLAGDTSAVLMQLLKVDPDTGDLVIRQRASSAHGGVFGIAFSLLNLRPDITFAVPYFGGQRFGADLNRGSIVGYAWPKFWAAGFVVGEVPGAGSFLVFADDPRLRPKCFRLFDTAVVQGLGFQACTDGPYETRTEAEVCTWRFNTFAGSWCEPAERYKQWLARTYRLKPRRERATRWTDDIALVWPRAPYPSHTKAMAKRIDPKRVLILDLGWAKGFNRNCPHYVPANKALADHVRQAHALGYRYGVYTAQKLIDKHAHAALFTKLGLELVRSDLHRDPKALKRTRDTEEDIRQGRKTGHFLGGVHPGREKWIDYYAGVLAGFHETYGIDLFYEDVTGSDCMSGQVVDGRTLHEGTVACDRRIRERLPKVGLAGEFWTEVNVACGQEFGLSAFMAWFNEAHKKRLAQHGHPILSYVFSDFCSYISYRPPVRSGPKWHWDQSVLEVMGALPVWATFLDDAGGEARVVLERAKLFAQGFRPHFPKTWGKNVAAYMRHPAGRVVRYVRDGWSSLCFEETPQGDRLRYARLKDKRTLAIDEPVTIDGWVAYGDKGPIGLDPSRWTCVFPGKPTEGPVTITALPDGVFISQTRLTDDYCLVRLAGKGRGTVRWRTLKPNVTLVAERGRLAPGTDRVDVRAPGVLLFGVGNAPEAGVGKPLPVATWHPVRIAHGTVIGPTKLHYPPKPWKLGDKRMMAYGVFPFVGGRGAEVSIDGRVHLPGHKRLAIEFHMGRFGGIGDGVHYVVRVNGQQVWKTLSNPKKRCWTPAVVPLGDYAGREVLLSLALDAGPSGFNLSCDESLWGEPKLVLQPPQ